MPTQTKQPCQGLLFSEPSIAETGVWCELSDGIDPAEWAHICRYIGKLTPHQFKSVKKKLLPNPDYLISRLKRLFYFNSGSLVGIPFLSVGPSGIGGEFQRERQWNKAQKAKKLWSESTYSSRWDRKIWENKKTFISEKLVTFSENLIYESKMSFTSRLTRR